MTATAAIIAISVVISGASVVGSGSNDPPDAPASSTPIAVSAYEHTLDIVRSRLFFFL